MPESSALPVNNYRIVFVHGKRGVDGGIVQVLRSCAGDVDLQPEMVIPDDRACDLLLVDYDNIPPKDKTVLVEGFGDLKKKMQLLLISSGKVKDDFPKLFGSKMLTNVISRNGSAIPDSELFITLQKLRRGDIFGLEKYYSWGVDVYRRRITGSAETKEILEEVMKFARGHGIPSRFADLYSNVADELITNAIFNAPVDGEGKNRNRHLRRDEVVELAANEQPEITLACDGMRLGLSVADPFGSLTRQRLIDYLSRCFRRTEDQIDKSGGGAGLGFYYMFECLSHMIVNISPGKRTELIGLLNVKGSYRDFVGETKSFNVFMT